MVKLGMFIFIVFVRFILVGDIFMFMFMFIMFWFIIGVFLRGVIFMVLVIILGMFIGMGFFIIGLVWGRIGSMFDGELRFTVLKFWVIIFIGCCIFIRRKEK